MPTDWRSMTPGQRRATYSEDQWNDMMKTEAFSKSPFSDGWNTMKSSSWNLKRETNSK